MRVFGTATTVALLWAGVAAAPAWAQLGTANEGSGEAPRGAQVSDAQLKASKPIPLPQVEAEAARSAPMLDDAAMARAMGAVTRTMDGTESRTEAPPAVKDALSKLNAAPADGSKDGAQSGISAQPDPAFEVGETERQVFGADDRVQVTDSTIFPFRAIGYLEISNQDGTGGSCSGTLIGPRTVLTAAHCLYDHERQGGWMEQITFFPAANGPEKIPFGGFAAESITILQGFIDNYKGEYYTVIPWDLGVITLADPLGDHLGYLPPVDIQSLGDFSANVVGYPGDKPMATMWRASCDVLAEQIMPEVFSYECDTFQGSSGAAVYAYDNVNKARVVLGVNVAGGPGGNMAVRLNSAYMEWLASVYK